MLGRKTLWRPFAVSFGMMALASCSSPVSPGVQPQIANAMNNFQYQVTATRNFTDVATYHWQNTGTVASVNQATTVTAGTATLVIFDAGGLQVYSRSLTDNGTFTTAAGTSGSWTIQVTYSNADATVNFRVQKTP